VRRAFELRGSGLPYERIAAEMGVGIGTVHRWCQEAMATLPTDSAEALRKLALVRCERVMAGLMAQLRAGDATLPLVDAILKTQVHLARLCGFVLDDDGGLTINVELPAPRPQKLAPQAGRAAKAIG
jgi:hypothetical protein